MKVLQIIHQDPRKGLGGSETYCQHLVEGLRDFGLDVAVFYRKNGTGADPLYIEDKDRIAYFGVDLKALPAYRDRFQYTNSYANPDVLTQFLRVLEAFHPDIVHIHHLLTLSVDIIGACRELGLPMVVTLHDFWYFCHRITLTLPDDTRCSGPAGGVACRACGKPSYNHFPGFLLQPGQALASIKRNKRLLMALNQCDRLYAPSHALLARYESEGIDPKRLLHRPYGIPALPVKPLTVNKPVVFGFIGNLSPHKGAEVLIQAARSLNGRPIKVRIFGSGDSDYEKQLRQKAEGSPVEFAGRFERTDLQNVLHAMDILVMPSLWEENSPLVVHEASAVRLPIVASAIGGLTEIVSKNRGGILFPPGDANALAQVLKSLAEKPESIPAMQKKMKRIRSIEQDVDETLSDYEQLVGRRKD